MAGRKTDYFGSFLDAMKKEGSADPSIRVLKVLRDGERSLKVLVQLTDISLSELIDVVGKLESLGLVERIAPNDDTLRVTTKGREYAMDLQ